MTTEHQTAGQPATSFFDCLSIFSAPDAAFFASALFVESFAHPFPVPRDDAGLAVSTPVPGWHQYVALYRWPTGLIETVGFCNWVRFGEVYLEGGMCVKRDFYRRLPREHWRECRARGGIAQLIMESAATELNDCAAWFGYCGDRQAMIVDKRVGYEETRFPHLIVKWFQNRDPAEQNQLIEDIARIGPF
jgi:hypothetical protein